MGSAVKYRTRVFLHWVFGANACLLIVLSISENHAWTFMLGCACLLFELFNPPKP